MSGIGWITIDGTFRIHRDEVRALCEQHFGPEHTQKFNPVTKRKMDNHGNWMMTFSAKLQLRYKRDVTWFMLMASHLMDPPAMKQWDKEVW